MKKTQAAFIMILIAGSLFADPQPVLNFKLNEGEGTTIRSSGSATISGRILNSDFTWGEGRTGGKALYFTNPIKCRTGKNGCAIADTENLLDFTIPFTVCLWIKPDSGLVDNSQYTIVGNVASDYGPGWRLLFGWGSLRFSAGQGTKDTQMGFGISPASFPHKKGIWHHVAISYDGKKVTLYLNGIVAGEKEAILKQGNKILSIGAYSQGYAYGFRGAVSDLRIYNVLLTPEQILNEAQGIEEQ